MPRLRSNMTSQRPYFIRALYQWIVDNGLTPYIAVNARLPNVKVPEQYVLEEGHILLNISPSAVIGLKLDNDKVEFSARFDGKARHLHIPPSAIMAIYAKENNQGMIFADEKENESPPEPESGKKPALKLVK